MKEFLDLKQREKTQVIQEATKRHPLISSRIAMEKDFWICWVLDQLYSIPKLATNITFKGGTSLSKCYGLIQRFSEDCDLTIEKNFIGITEDLNPKTAPSSKQKKKRLAHLNKLTVKAVEEKIKPLLFNALQNSLEPYFDSSQWKLTTNEENLEHLFFSYPRSQEPELYGEGNYIDAVIRLEFGARGDRDPSETCLVEPYLKEVLPEIFTASTKTIQVNSLSPIRTFWEKITILHKEHHRSTSQKFGKRLFRHYYDIAMLDSQSITRPALENNMDLLTTVVKNNEMFFQSKWASYNTAKIGTLKLFPNNHFLSDLQQDYRLMSTMFFGETPSFERIMDIVKDLEQRINVFPKEF